LSNRQLVNEVYQAFGQGDVAGVLARFHADAEWRLAEGHPYAPGGEAWIGHEEIARKFFMRAGTEWEGFTVAPHRWHDAGDTVVIEGRYTGTYRPTGKRLAAQVCHVWTVRDGRIQRFQQYVNTAHLRDVMGVS